MIIFLKGKLETLDFFIDRMAESVEDAVVLNISAPDFWKKLESMDAKIDENTHVLTINNVGVGLEINKENYWETKKVKLHNIQVDTPVWYHDTLDLNLKCMQVMKLSILVGIFSSIRLLPMQPHPGHHSIAAF